MSIQPARGGVGTYACWNWDILVLFLQSDKYYIIITKPTLLKCVITLKGNLVCLYPKLLQNSVIVDGQKCQCLQNYKSWFLWYSLCIITGHYCPFWNWTFLPSNTISRVTSPMLLHLSCLCVFNKSHRWT